MKFSGLLMDLRTHLLEVYDEVDDPKDRIFIAQNLKTLLTEIELHAMYHIKEVK